ncbi:MAG: TolC family protein [Tannerella sp.]|jgi:outer membrane protein TolC|nr:TolC family protein [Tannerella sp.]
MKRFCLIITILTSYTLIYSQEIYNLKQCIETGLENNYSIRIIRNEEQIAHNNAIIGNAGYLPTIDLSGGVNGSVYNFNYNYSDGTSDKVSNNNTETANIGVNLNWTLFDGFGIQANYARLKELEQMGELNTRISIEDLIADIAGVYYSMIRQKIRLNNLQSAVNLSKERLRIVEERYHIGLNSLLELNQAKAYFNADSSRLISQLETVYSTSVSLGTLMALKPDHTISVGDSSISLNTMLDKDELWQNILISNTSLLKSQKNKTLSEIDYKRAISRNFPYVRLNGGYGFTSNWYSTGNTDMQERLGLNYGITVGFTLFDGFNRRREQRNAQIQIKNSELRVQNVELALNDQFSKLWMAYQNNLQLWSLEKENLKVAQDTYSTAMERYRLGELSGIESREAQNTLLEAEERRSISEYNTKLCEISLLQLSGQLLNTLYPENGK